MTEQTLKERLTAEMKTAMKSGEKDRLGTIRLILAAIKQREVDERIALDDLQIVGVLDKMCKQRRESITQYEAASRADLAAVEQAELLILQEFLPRQLSDSEIDELIQAAVKEVGASSPNDMGKVMNLLRPKLQGRADVGQVSQSVKTRLSS